MLIFFLVSSWNHLPYGEMSFSAVFFISFVTCLYMTFMLIHNLWVIPIVVMLTGAGAIQSWSRVLWEHHSYCSRQVSFFMALVTVINSSAYSEVILVSFLFIQSAWLLDHSDVVSLWCYLPPSKHLMQQVRRNVVQRYSRQGSSCWNCGVWLRCSNGHSQSQSSWI